MRTDCSIDELMAALRDLVDRARTGVLRSSEMSDPTITVTNLGDLGVDSVFGVIYPPQVALVGFGRVAERPVGCRRDARRAIVRHRDLVRRSPGQRRASRRAVPRRDRPPPTTSGGTMTDDDARDLIRTVMRRGRPGGRLATRRTATRRCRRRSTSTRSTSSTSSRVCTSEPGSRSPSATTPSCRRSKAACGT